MLVAFLARLFSLMTNQHDTNARPDDAPLRIVGHRLHKVENVARADAPVEHNFAPASNHIGVEKQDNPQRRTSMLRQVVLVDRDIDALRDIAIALREEYDFHITISGNEALNLLRSGAIDTLVVGQTLYSSTGLNVLAEARRQAPNTHRILLANAVEATAIESGPDITPFKILERPCTLDKLQALLESNAGEREAPEQAAIKDTARQQQQTSIIRSHADTHDPADFEHVVLESLPEPPRRKPRAADAALQSLPVIVYTDNAEFHRAITIALKDKHDVRLCTQLERAAEFAEMGQCPLVITDRAANQVELQRISIALRSLDAGLIMIAAGPPEVGAALRRFLGTGALHSFLTKPINVPLVRLAVESGKRQYLQNKSLKQAAPELNTTPTKSPFATRQRKAAAYFVPTDLGNYKVDEYGPSAWRRIAPLVAIIALLIVAGAGGGWYWWRQKTPSAVITDTSSLARHIEYAKQAYAAGRYTMPANDSALFYYSEALKIAPQNPAATQGLEQTIERVIEQAEQALLDERLDTATEAIATVRTLQPKNKRLPFLEGQLSKERKTLLARDNNRAAPTNTTISSAAPTTTLPATPIPEITRPISNETQRRESVNRWLATARQRIAQERLLQPQNDSAEYYLRQAERADPDNAAVRQSLRDVGTRLIVHAKEALSRQQFDQARKRAFDATRFGADDAVVEKLQQEIDAAAGSQSRGNYLRLALQRTRDNQLFEPERDNAKFYLSQLQRLDPAATETQQATRALGLKLIESVDQAIAQNQINVAAQLLNEVRRLEFNDPELAAAETRLRKAHTPVQETTPSTIVAAAPKAIKMVPPKFPADAARAGIQGWVDVEFHITADGDIADVRAIASSPPAGIYAGQFERAAIAAIRQYKYEARNLPRDQTQRMVMRVQFKLN